MLQETYLIEECKKINITLNETQIKQFMKYYEMIVEWNKVMNLTGITEYKEVVIKHFIDSLSLVHSVTSMEEKQCKLLDLGTGAGFPGIPLKIAFPKLKVTLVDSLNKRIKFLNEVIQTLGLQDIEAIHSRAETLGKNKEYRESYDYCVSRAVANLAVLSEYCLPFVKVGGFFVSYKSGAVEEELEKSKKAIHVLGGKKERCDYFSLPDTDINRALVCIRKISKTPKQYPRTEGKPAKEPIV